MRTESIAIHGGYAVFRLDGLNRQPFLMVHAQVLSVAFNVEELHAFLRSHARPVCHDRSMSRRFLGLRLFLSLAAGGWAGYAVHIERAFELAKLFTETLER
jgi:hypothetical protein